jgi:O-6-methylguanine DNA methyltransferase
VRRRQKRYTIILTKNSSLTSFQKKVYNAVLEIPRGRVRSYKWVAARIGMPRASRAVGQALKRNPYTVIIPCHRVVRANGEIGGYSRGLKAKKSLLKKEKTWYNRRLKNKGKKC